MTHAFSKSDSSFIGSHAVIESNKCIAMGKVSYVEGEIFEVEFPQYRNFDPGDPVRAIIYSSEGMLRFETAVIAQDTGSVILLTPPKMLALFLKKRKHPRLNVDVAGLIYSYTDAAMSKTHKFPEHKKISIDNISLGGIGFFAYDMEVGERTVFFTELKFDNPYLCNIEVIHKKQTDQGFYYGGKFANLKNEELNSVRAFILKHQIENYCENKKIAFEQALTSAGIKKEA
jgi:hypothetical protein